VLQTAQRLPNGVPLLPDLLARRGYDTFAGSDLATVAPGQIARFDEEEKVYVPEVQQGSDPVVLQLRRIARRFAERPTFAWFHLEHAHYPLTPRDPLRYDRGYEGPFRDRFTSADDWQFHSAHLLTARELDHVRALYDSAVRDVDDTVRQLLLVLDAAGATERTIVVITADHGEHVGDHDITLDHSTAWDEVLHVPLFFLWPGHLPPGHVVPQRVQLVDLVPTLLSLARLPGEPGLDGRDLTPALLGRTLPEAPAFAQPTRAVVAQYRGDEKLILSTRGEVQTFGAQTVEYGKHALYDLARDPLEKDDLFEREPARARQAEAAFLAARRRLQTEANGIRGDAAGQAAFQMMLHAGYLHAAAQVPDAEEDR
jgi:arylsulfatase A-like enzyme